MSPTSGEQTITVQASRIALAYSFAGTLLASLAIGMIPLAGISAATHGGIDARLPMIAILSAGSIVSSGLLFWSFCLARAIFSPPTIVISPLGLQCVDVLRRKRFWSWGEVVDPQLRPLGRNLFAIVVNQSAAAARDRQIVVNNFYLVRAKNLLDLIRSKSTDVSHDVGRSRPSGGEEVVLTKDRSSLIWRGIRGVALIALVIVWFVAISKNAERTAAYNFQPVYGAAPYRPPPGCLVHDLHDPAGTQYEIPKACAAAVTQVDLLRDHLRSYSRAYKWLRIDDDAVSASCVNDDCYVSEVIKNKYHLESMPASLY